MRIIRYGLLASIPLILIWAFIVLWGLSNAVLRHHPDIVELQDRFVNTAQQISWDQNRCDPNSGEQCASPENPDEWFGGALDSLISERETLLARHDIMFFGRWEGGEGSIGGTQASAGGWYIPRHPCRYQDVFLFPTFLC